MLLLPSATLIQETDDHQSTTAIKDENSAAPNIEENGLK